MKFSVVCLYCLVLVGLEFSFLYVVLVWDDGGGPRSRVRRLRYGRSLDPINLP